MKRFILFFFILNMPYLTFAEVQQITLRKTKLKTLKLPSWQKVEGFHGGDITWIGPETSGPRPVIKLDLVAKKKWDFEQEKKALPQYLENKKEWINSKEGVLTASQLGQQSKKLSAPHLYNRVEYTMASQAYIEEDWLIKCPGALINLSFLVTPQRLTNLQETWDQFISSFKCL